VAFLAMGATIAPIPTYIVPRAHNKTDSTIVLFDNMMIQEFLMLVHRLPQMELRYTTCGMYSIHYPTGILTFLALSIQLIFVCDNNWWHISATDFASLPLAK